MLRLLLGLALGSQVLPARAASPRKPRHDSAVHDAVVRVFTVFRKPDFYQPWQMGPQDSMAGSGCLIAGGRILTNAHVVSDQVFVQVRRAGQAARYTARVEFVAHDSELAILKVDDPEFHAGSEPLELGELPQQRDSVDVYGFPDGGDDLSVTKGIVSRIEVTPYAHSDRELLTIQTDAAVNPGNSGGPMVQDGKLVGITFQMNAESENVGYAVPEPVIRRFLADVADGRYDGVPDLGIHWQALENRALRDWLGLKPGAAGVRVSTTVFGGAAYGVLEPGDVVASIDGVKVSGDGTVPFRRNERVLFSHLLFLHQAGEKARLGVVRRGRELPLDVALRPAPSLVPGPTYGARPRYFIYAGLVFTPLTRNYVDNWEWNEVPISFKSYLEFGLPAPERRELVVLAHVLPHALNTGYHDLRGVIVDRVNGRAIGALEDLPAAFARPEGRYHVIETDPLTDFAGRIVLDAAQADKDSAGVLAAFGVPADRFFASAP
ncbi:MAG: trypsin-like peptidase domain-containing protein [Elusimicrobia bacterium]|nr:trypsin-like peptidase domain-containing protein [Elusimicrobiota bacterium]